MPRRFRTSLALVVGMSVPGLTHLLVLAGRRVLPADPVRADFLLQALLLPALLAPIATPIATVFLVRRWRRLGPVPRVIAVTACILAWIGTVQLLVALQAMQSLLWE